MCVAEMVDKEESGFESGFSFPERLSTKTFSKTTLLNIENILPDKIDCAHTRLNYRLSTHPTSKISARQKSLRIFVFCLNTRLVQNLLD